MKKSATSKVNDQQLSLFDNFTVEITSGTIQQADKAGTNIQNLKIKGDDSDNNHGRQEDHAGQQQGSNLQDGAGKLQSEATLFTVEGPATDTVRTNEESGHIDTVPERNGTDISANGQGPDWPRNGVIGSRGNSLEGTGDNGRAVNYHNTETLDSYLSFGKERHLKSNLDALELLGLLETEDRPATSTEQEVLARYSGWGGLKEILLDPNNDSD